jgi:hypothetical protein
MASTHPAPKPTFEGLNTEIAKIVEEIKKRETSRAEREVYLLAVDLKNAMNATQGSAAVPTKRL